MSIWAENETALLSLARTQRRLSWRYRRWAVEDEAAGRLVLYRRNVEQARKLWRSAKWALGAARDQRALAQRKH